MSADSSEPPLVAGVELGGTKAVAVLARGSEIIERRRIPTGDPPPTLEALSRQLATWAGEGQQFAAIGIGSFGPVGLDRQRADYGYVTTTPKPGWANTEVRGHFAERFDVPIGFDNDVNGAALAEVRWGAAEGCAVAVYLTIGTGVGGGVVVDGRSLHGLVHPEHGHFRVRRRADDDFAGVCPYHGDCIEGLTSGPAIAARAGAPAEALGPEHPVWMDVANELGELMATIVLALSPHRIVVGGGVGCGQRWLLPRIREATLAGLAGYVAAVDAASVESLIVPAGLQDDAGPLGAVAIGLDVLERRE
jgi:fructokinase